MSSGFQSGLVITQLSSRFYVSAQISVADLFDIAEQGFKSIINNRPDHEAARQPKSVELAIVAADLGMKFLHIPVDPNLITNKDVDELDRACVDLESPILLFCRSGARSTKLWKLSVHSEP